MRFLFENESYSFEALRAAGYATYAGAELGEVLVTCRDIPENDDETWSSRWAATAARVAAVGRESLAAGHRVSAREALLRASNYYRTADFFRRSDPADDPESARLAAASQETFATAAELMDVPPRPLRIPFEDTTLPGYLFTVDAQDTPRPTIVYHGGYDSTLEEDYFALAAGALRRGYNVLAFDGPGQGTALRDQGLHFRFDWETVVSSVVDFVEQLAEVDRTQIVLVGTSMGGYLAARAAAFEHRIAACILHDGVYDMAMSISAIVGAAGRLDGGLDTLMRQSPGARWAIDNGRWTFGVPDAATLVDESSKYTMRGIAGQIQCPTLVLEAEADQFFAGQPQLLFDELRCEKQYMLFPENEGGGEHCHEGAVAVWHQRAIDWLDDVLGD